MASRNGLNPKIRGAKGKGFGRALPAPFGFDNGLQGSGSGNSYLTIPSFIGKPLPPEFTIEFNAKYPISGVKDLAGIMQISTVAGSVFVVRSTAPNSIQAQIGSGVGGGYSGSSIFHVAYCMDLITGRSRTLIPNTLASETDRGSSLTDFANSNTTKFQLYSGAEYTVGDYSNAAIDEFRVYNRFISKEEFDTNDNSGHGNNPFATEFLICWLKFEQFEMLDFSTLQDGSDIRLGIRDFSGNNNHGLPVNMDTNPMSSTYVIKPF